MTNSARESRIVGNLHAARREAVPEMALQSRGMTEAKIDASRPSLERQVVG